jgi:hypothetical protein
MNIGSDNHALHVATKERFGLVYVRQGPEGKYNGAQTVTNLEHCPPHPPRDFFQLVQYAYGMRKIMFVAQ